MFQERFPAPIGQQHRAALHILKVSCLHPAVVDEGEHKTVCHAGTQLLHQVQGQGHAYIWDVEQDDPACIESEREVMTKRQTCISEEVIQTGGGTRLLTTYKSPLYDLDGGVMGTVGVAIDVTQERAYEQALHQKNRTLETLFTTMDCGVMCHSLDGARILSINRAALEILGYESQEEMLRDGFQTVANSVLDEDKPKLRESIHSLNTVGDSASVEYRVLHKDGRLIHVMGNIKLVQENGEMFYQRFLLDCTAQKMREEEERTEKERRHMELVQALSIDYSLVCFFDLDTGVGSPLRVHNCRYDVLDNIFMDAQLDMEESLGRYIDRCVCEEDRASLRRALSRPFLLEELADKNITYLNYRTLCGEEVRFFQMKAVRAGSWENYHGVVLGFRNVDDETRKEMEKKMLLEDALAQANRASKAKSVFLSNMSHDIRTPMNAILGFTNLALESGDPATQREYLQNIDVSSRQLLDLINNILELSRIENHKIIIEEEVTGAEEMFHRLCTIFDSDLKKKRLTCTPALELTHAYLYIDPTHYAQIFLNLVGNAIKYTPDGGRIVLSAGQAGDKVWMEVDDNGIGIPDADRERIFERFYRVDKARSRQSGGTGLGLSIAKEIVELHGGTISAHSGDGLTTFQVALPKS